MNRNNTEINNSREAYLRRRVTRLAAFYRHALLYAVIVSGLWVVYFSAKSFVLTDWWQGWLMGLTVGWGLSLLMHAFGVLPRMGLFSIDWEEKKVGELMLRDSEASQSDGTHQSASAPTRDA